MQEETTTPTPQEPTETPAETPEMPAEPMTPPAETPEAPAMPEEEKPAE